MAEIDTTAPFASVRDAVYMFGEQYDGKTQRAFLTTNALNLEKIHSLEVELHQLREEHANTEDQLLIAETAATDANKELAELKNVLKENNQKAEKVISSKISLLESQLDTTSEQEKKRLQEVERGKEEIKNLHEELKHLNFQYHATLDTQKKVQEENIKLREETNTLMCKHEQYVKEEENSASEQMKDLIEDLFATKEMLSKANVACANIEEELRISKIKNLERANDEAYNSTCKIEEMKSKLQDANNKQEEIILVVEKLKDELIVAKEGETKALQEEVDAKLTLKRMKVEVEESKVAKEKVRMLMIQLEDMNSKLQHAAQEEKSLLASLASLKAELKSTNNELDNIKNEVKETTIEMEEQINQLQADLNVAIMDEAQTKECLLNLNEALQQVTTEAVEAKAAATQAVEEIVVKTQELQEALLHNKTLECRLEAAMKEIEATKASEVFAHTEVKFLKKKVNKKLDASENRQEVAVSYDEYEIMIKRIVDSEDLAKKRIAAALAQVDAFKASELQTSKKLETTKNLLERSQMATKQAVKVAEVAEAAKFAVEGELRKWRYENEQRRKATVAAVMAVGNNGVVQNGSPLVFENNLQDEKTTSTNELNGGSFNGNPKQSLAQVLGYNFLRIGKARKVIFPSKISSYFNKKIRQRKNVCKLLK